MRKVIGCLVLSAVAAGCGPARLPPATTASAIRIHESPSPFREVTAGPVRALIPDRWEPIAAADPGDPREGIIARPRPGAFREGRVREGMAALWIDGTRVGVPSDYYYLAAARHALPSMARGADCHRIREVVFADHLPAWASGDPDSPGDYVARGTGRCRVGRTDTRWAYFVAAPGYGPVRELGIPSSGMYLVVAVMPDGPRAAATLNRLLLRTRFGDATVEDLIRVARRA
ncbi:MAG: hypothetical protein KatS3mg014_1197 [Actinomycetota bacterium]|nr:MAG: hypothetical protein KatS3mg014_1197 [Actinomycetota bacterium]